MKLLLTSTGLSHQEIAKSFVDMAGNDLRKLKIAFITSAAVTDEEKKYVQKSYDEMVNFGISKDNIQTIDVYIKDKALIIDEANVMYVCGGNTFHLMDQLRKTGLGDKVREFVNAGKLYLGVSAGTIVLTPSISIASVEPADLNEVGLTDMHGLDLVPYEVSVHSPEIVPFESVQIYAKNSRNRIYAISDKTAIKVSGNDFEIIGEKLFKAFN